MVVPTVRPALLVSGSAVVWVRIDCVKPLGTVAVEMTTTGEELGEPFCPRTAEPCELVTGKVTVVERMVVALPMLERMSEGERPLFPDCPPTALVGTTGNLLVPAPAPELMACCADETTAPTLELAADCAEETIDWNALATEEMAPPVGTAPCADERA